MELPDAPRASGYIVREEAERQSSTARVGRIARQRDDPIQRAGLRPHREWDRPARATRHRPVEPTDRQRGGELREGWPANLHIDKQLDNLRGRELRPTKEARPIGVLKWPEADLVSREGLHDLTPGLEVTPPELLDPQRQEELLGHEVIRELVDVCAEGGHRSGLGA